MSREAYNPPDPTGWRALFFRTVAFTVESQQHASRDWWKDLTGTDADQTTRKKEQVEQVGLLDGTRRLTVSIDPFKILWAYEPQTTLEEQFKALPTLGSVEDGKITYLALMDRWLATAPEIKRIAFHLACIYGVATHRAGYILLNRLLPTVEVDPESADFSYRVNRKCPSQIESNISINQLAGWAFMKRTRIVSTLVASEFSTPVPVGNEELFVIVELDINTDQDRKVALPAESLGALYRELADRATARAVRGDFIME